MNDTNSFAEGMLAGRSGYGYGCDGGFGNGWEGIFGIIALMAIAGGGWFGNGGYGNNDYSNALQTSILENSANQRENCSQFTATNQNIMTSAYQTQGQLSQGFTQLFRDLCTQGASLTATSNGNAKEIMGMLYQMARDQDRCCCETKQLIQQQGCDMRMLLEQQENQRLRDRVGALEADARMCGVVRYPNELVYTAGNPFTGCDTSQMYRGRCNSTCR